MRYPISDVFDSDEGCSVCWCICSHAVEEVEDEEIIDC